MTEIEKIRMLSELVVARSRAMKIDDAWEKYTDSEQEQAFKALNDIQNQILRCDLQNQESKRIALSMLLDSNDDPNFADDFKNQLFRKLRQTEQKSNQQHVAITAVWVNVWARGHQLKII